MAIIGIDLGTTNSLVCAYVNGKATLIPNALGSYMTPSIVAVTEQRELLVGAMAKEWLVLHPEQAGAYFKEFMGSNKKYVLAGQSYRPEDLSSFVLRSLYEDAKRYLEEEIEEVIISVPAYFNDNQRNATKIAAQLAGLKVRRLINEPSAAALYYRMKEMTGDVPADGRFLVIDFGGGTLDVSVVDCFMNIIEIIAVAGDNHLGGNHIDLAIAEAFCEEHGLVFEKLSAKVKGILLKQAEAIKIELSKENCLRSEFVITIDDVEHSFMMTYERLGKLCEPLFNRVGKIVVKALQDSGDMEFDEVILVGGSSKNLVYLDYLEKLLHKRPKCFEETDLMVAMGVGTYAAIVMRKEDIKDVVMTDVCPFSLGAGSVMDEKDNNPHMTVMIPRSSTLPAERTTTFYSICNGQPTMNIRIFQGESYYTKDNLLLGNIEIPLPPMPKGEAYVTTTFRYDIDGILNVELISCNGVHKEITIVGENMKLTEAEKASRIKRLKQLAFSERGSDEDEVLMEQLLSLFEQVPLNQREEIQYLIESLRETLGSGRLAERQMKTAWIRERVAINLKST